MQLRARQLKVDDRPLCQGFSCGNAAFQREVADWIRRDIWTLMPEYMGTRFRTVIVVDSDADDCLVGFGTWLPVKVVEPLNAAAPEDIELLYFGVAVDYQGRATLAGELCADRLWETILDDIENTTLSILAPAITLLCHVDNRRALKFWTRQEFAVVENETALKDHFRMAFQAAPDAPEETV